MKRSGFREMSPYRYPLYILLHPKDGFQEMMINRKQSPLAAGAIVAAWLLVELFYRTCTDFDMNPFRIQQTNLLRVAVITVLMYAMACVANWCFCTLMDGKGKLKDIFIVGAYSLLPYVIVRFFTVSLSWVLVGSEKILLDFCVVISQLWCAVTALCGLQEIHEYSLKKVLFSLFLTVVGIVIMLFLSLLVIMLGQQLYYFAATVAFELRY